MVDIDRVIKGLSWYLPGGEENDNPYWKGDTFYAGELARDTIELLNWYKDVLDLYSGKHIARWEWLDEIVEGLENCAEGGLTCVSGCNFKASDANCHQELLREAAALLKEIKKAFSGVKELEPHLLTLPDLYATIEGDVVWMESRYKIGADKWHVRKPRPLMRDKDRAFIGYATVVTINEDMFDDPFGDDIGTDEYRYWSAKPSDELRLSIPWSV